MNIYEMNEARTTGPFSLNNPNVGSALGLLGPSTSGVYIDEHTAQNISTVYACITIISQTLASLPIGCFRKEKNDSRVADDQHPANWLFNKSPDDVMTSFMFRETMQGHILLRGNTYSEIVRNFRGQAIELHLLDPRRVSVDIEEQGTYQYPIYHYAQPTGPRIKLDRSQMLHIPNWTTNGLVGLAPLTIFREALGMTAAADRYASEYFKKGGHPLGFLTKATHIGDKERGSLQKEWLELFGGIHNAHQVGVLHGGLDWKNIGLSNTDAQLLELRQFQRYVIAEIFRVPPFLIGDVEQPLSNIEFLLIQFLIFTLLPWMKRHEGEMNMKCFTRMEQFKYYLEYNADAVLRGDMKARQEAFRIMAANGALLIDEWRAYENMPKLPNGLGQVPLIMASQIAKLDDVISGKANLDTTNKSGKKTKKPKEQQKEANFNRVAKYYSSLDEHDRDRLKGVLLAMNHQGTFKGEL